MSTGPTPIGDGKSAQAHEGIGVAADRACRVCRVCARLVRVSRKIASGEGVTRDPRRVKGEEVDSRRELKVEGGSMRRGANIQDPSTDLDYCQGISTKDLPFERETGKWSGWKGLAGIGEFGETAPWK